MDAAALSKDRARTGAFVPSTFQVQSQVWRRPFARFGVRPVNCAVQQTLAERDAAKAQPVTHPSALVGACGRLVLRYAARRNAAGLRVCVSCCASLHQA